MNGVKDRVGEIQREKNERIQDYCRGVRPDILVLWDRRPADSRYVRKDGDGAGEKKKKKKTAWFFFFLASGK